MTRLHPGPFTVSNLRHHRRQRTLAVMLALAGTVACGEKDPTGPRSPDLAAPAKQLTVPTTASFITQLEADATRAELENSRRGVNSLNYETYAGMLDIASRDQWFAAPADAPPPTSDPYYPPSDGGGCASLIDGCAAYSVQISGYVPPARVVGKATGKQSAGRQSTKSAPTTPGFFYVYDGYDGDPCKYYRDEIRRLRGDYDRAYAEFWENLTVNFWRFPLNWINGGPVDQMRSSFRQMYFVALASRSYNCTRPPRDAYTIP
jgi:hypothetical protein